MSSPVPVEVEAYQPMNLRSWRSAPDRVGEYRQLLATPLFREIMAVLQSCIPYGYPLRGGEVTEVQGLIELGRVQGYQDCLYLLRSLGEFEPPPAAPVEATFENEETLPPQPKT